MYVYVQTKYILVMHVAMVVLQNLNMLCACMHSSKYNMSCLWILLLQNLQGKINTIFIINYNYLVLNYFKISA